jgi:hypothetical protein
MEEPVEISCPWCGESMTTFVDVSASDQEYIEDCQVCCRPMVLTVQTDPISVIVDRS